MADPPSHTNPDRITGTLSVYDDESDAGAYDQPIGHVKIDGEGYLYIADADPARAAFLESLVQHMNSKPALAWVSDVPGGEDLGEYVTRGASINRGEAGYAQSLCNYVDMYYGVRLV